MKVDRVALAVGLAAGAFVLAGYAMWWASEALGVARGLQLADQVERWRWWQMEKRIRVGAAEVAETADPERLAGYADNVRRLLDSEAPPGLVGRVTGLEVDGG